MRTSTSIRLSMVGACALVLVMARAGHPLQDAESAPADLPPIVLEDFETATLGSRPYLWKEGRQNAAEVKIGSERAALKGDDANKALKYEYAFPAAFDAAHGIEAGPMGRPLPGSLTGVSMQVHGDMSRNAVAVRLKDREGETFEWRIAVTWTGWRRALVPVTNPALALRSGRGNGKPDVPLTLDVVRVARLSGGLRKGEIMVDDITAECRFAKVATLYDTAQGVKPETWRANRNRSTIGLLADSLVPRQGKDVSVLKMEYEYENGTDASVEYSRILPAGPGHGTLIAEVYGDGSNNILRFRMQDGDDRIWQATWASVLVDWSGWKTLYVDTRTLRQTSGGDPSAEMERFPVKFYSIVSDDCSPSDALPGVESGRKGEIYLGRLLFGSEK